MSTDLSPSSVPVPPTGEDLPARWEERLRLLVDAAQDYAIFAMDAQRRVDFWSAGAARLFLYTEKQVLGVPGDIIFTPEDRAAGAPQQEAEEAARSGRAADERWHMRMDGSRFFASGVMSPLRDADGAVIGFVKITRDLTSRMLAEARMRSIQQELEERVRQRTMELDVANEELRVANEELRIEIEQRQQAETLRLEAARRIGTAQEEERRRISRELHDELGQHVAALTIGLAALETNPPDRLERIKALQALTDTLGREMHALAVQLRPTSLDDLGLHGALSSYIELWSKRAGVRVELHMPQLLDQRLCPEMELALYRMVQEALTNVMKHAEASVVSIIVERRPNEVFVIVEDDGRGFDPGALERSRAGLGLLGIKERAVQFGGNVAVESQVGRGTSLFIRIPLSK